MTVTAGHFSSGQSVKSPNFFSVHKITACDSVLHLLNPVNTFVLFPDPF